MTDSEQPTQRTLAYLAEIPVDRVKGIGPRSMERLAGFGIRSVADLLLSPPRRYLDRSQITTISSAPLDEEVTVAGTVRSVSRRRISRNRQMVEATVFDDAASIRVVWFNPYIKLTEGDEVALSGKVERYRGTLQMKSPALDRISDQGAQTTGRVVPIYSGAGGLKPTKVRTAVENAVARSVPVVDVVPEAVLDRYDLVDRSFAIQKLHLPEQMSDVAPARRRLAFDEFLRIQMALRARAHDDFETQTGVANSVRGPLFDRFTTTLPFELTADQVEALGDILEDMAASTPLHRLLQGEVGSGKTVVVVAALLTSVESGHQGAVMAPTEVLATQHYLGTARALIDADMAPSMYAEDTTGTGSLFGGQPAATRPVCIGLFTGSRVAVNFRTGDVSRADGLSWLRDGTIDIAFGTQALIQEGIEFRSLGITVVDEQHRFGVEQRVMLREADRGDGVPDLLLMTATPIPRTFVMALYGDLDVSTIRTLPPGRVAIETSAVPASGADENVDELISETVGESRQVFVVCPLVDDSDSIDARSATAEFRRMTRSLPSVRVGLLHGQMSSADKATVMEQFRTHELDVLVATTVVEVGIDVPNATLMVIRNAERFGLSQLHQLRGRVGRGAHGGSCVLVVDEATTDGERRVEAMVGSTDGFALAEIDLEIRGHGTLFGSAQSGAGDLRHGDLLRDVELITTAADCAREAVDDDRHSAFVTGVIDEFRLLMPGSEDWLTKS